MRSSGHLLPRAAVAAVVIEQAVGRAHGVALPAGEEARVVALIVSLPEAMKPSVLLDLEAGGRTELEVLSAAVARLAAEGGLAAPVRETAAAALARFGGHGA